MIVPQNTGWLVSVSYVSGFVAVFTLLVHQVAYLQKLGLPARTASFAAGLVGLLGLPGRLLLLLLGDRVRPSFVIAAIFFMLTLSVVLLFRPSLSSCYSWQSQRSSPPSARIVRSYIKMSKGSKALTNRFGTSTVWLMRRSTATLHSA